MPQTPEYISVTKPHEAEVNAVDTQTPSQSQDVLNKVSLFDLEQILDQEIDTLCPEEAAPEVMPPQSIVPASLGDANTAQDVAEPISLESETESAEMLSSPEQGFFHTMLLGSTPSAIFDTASEDLMLEALLYVTDEPLQRSEASSTELPELRVPDSEAALAGPVNAARSDHSDKLHVLKHSDDQLPVVDGSFDSSGPILFSGSFEDLASLSAPTAFQTFLPPPMEEPAPLLTVPESSNAVSIGANVAELETWTSPSSQISALAPTSVEESAPRPLPQVSAKPLLASTIAMDLSPEANPLTPEDAEESQAQETVEKAEVVAQEKESQDTHETNETAPTQETEPFMPDSAGFSKESLEELPVIKGVSIVTDTEETNNLMIEKVEDVTAKSQWTPPPQSFIQREAEPEPEPLSKDAEPRSSLLPLLLLILFSLLAITFWLLAALRS